MKHRVLMSGLIIAALLAVAAAAAGTESDVEKVPLVRVDALMRTPDKYQGPVRLRGVVTSVFPKEQRLGLVDAPSCCPTPCEGLQALPVKWAGAMPAMKAVVMVTGEIRKAGEKLEFFASSIETMEAAGVMAK